MFLVTWGKQIYEQLPDADVAFAYDTVKEVRVLDRRLGFVYYFILISVFLYIVIFVFMIEQQYLDNEKTTGWILTQVLNPARVANENLPLDLYESITNPGEQGATFIPTRLVITKEQTQGGYCRSHLHKCDTDKDCDIGDEMLQKPECNNGQCMRLQWCPSEDTECLGEDGCVSEEHNIDFMNYDIWFSANVHFHKGHIDITTTDQKNSTVYPAENANTYPIKDLLRMSNIEPGVIAMNGAIILVNVIFTCLLDQEASDACEISIESTNVDSSSGFNYVHNHYYDENGVEKRDTVRLYGIRMISFATGLGTRTSFAAIVLQVSSAIALLSVSQTAADFFLQYVVPERRHYVEQKIIPTEDFNQD